MKLDSQMKIMITIDTYPVNDFIISTLLFRNFYNGCDGHIKMIRILCTLIEYRLEKLVNILVKNRGMFV